MIILYVCWRLCKGTRQTFRNVFSFFDDKSCVTFLSEAGWKNCNNLCLLGPSMGNWHLSRPKQDETTAILFLISNCFMSKVCWDNCSNVSFRVKCGEVAVTLSKAVWDKCSNICLLGPSVCKQPSPCPKQSETTAVTSVFLGPSVCKQPSPCPKQSDTIAITWTFTTKSGEMA